MVDTESLHEDEDVALSAALNCVIAVWRQAPQPAAMDIVEEHARKIGSNHRAGLVMINIIRADSGRPDAFGTEARARAGMMGNKVGVPVLAVAHVVLATGMIGAVTRAMMSTLALMHRSQTPVRVFGEIDEAATWLATHVEAPLNDKGELAACLNERLRSSG